MNENLKKALEQQLELLNQCSNRTDDIGMIIDISNVICEVCKTITLIDYPSLIEKAYHRCSTK